MFIITLLYINAAIDAPGIDDHLGNDDFVYLFYEVKIFFFTLSNTVGDLNYPEYGSWEENSKQNKPASVSMMAYIWIVYYVSMYMMLIMMLNFLIAIMSDVYAKITEETEVIKMKQLREMLPEALIYKSKENKKHQK